MKNEAETNDLTKDILTQVKDEMGKVYESELFYERDLTAITKDVRDAISGYYGEDYSIICDETNNTPEDLNNGNINVTIIPIPILSKVFLEIVSVEQP